MQRLLLAYALLLALLGPPLASLVPAEQHCVTCSMLQSQCCCDHGKPEAGEACRVQRCRQTPASTHAPVPELFALVQEAYRLQPSPEIRPAGVPAPPILRSACSEPPDRPPRLTS